MKKIILILFCLIQTAAVAWAKDYHLVQTQMLDDGDAGGGQAKPSTVYVLVPPDDSRPFVFKTFDSKAMEAAVSGLPRGSLVHYDANGFLAAVPPAQLEALKAHCNEKGVKLVESGVN